MRIAFTAWDYQVTYLEISAVLVSLIAVGLAIRGTRWAWPFYLASALLYGWLFLEMSLLASALLQTVFVVAAIWGWFDWGSSGITESKVLTNRYRLLWVGGVLASWVVLAPLVQRVGGVATWLDAFVLVGSVAAQILMIRGYVECWPTWVVVNTVGTFHYANQNLWFTAAFYLTLLVMALIGWRTWARLESAGASRAAQTASVSPGGGE